MTFSDFLPTSFPSLPLPNSRLSLLASAGALSLFTASVLYRILTHTPHTVPKPIPSPLKTLSQEELAAAPYPSDYFPGTRDVQSPYGSVRVYEWGPEEGRKVLLVHGISTPCIALSGVAWGLVKKGCRVMLFDLFGRGYSDAPATIPHDTRLYATQILIALTSSPICWTTAPFSLIGYSLGGGIATAFAAHTPHLVDSLVLLAPAGLIRPRHIAASSKLLHTRGLLPEALLEWLVHRRLKAGPLNSNPEVIRALKSEQPDAPSTTTPVDAVVQEVPRGENLYDSSTTLLPAGEGRTSVMSVARAVDWQVDVHAGFVPSFVSSIRYAPIVGQHADWRIIGARLQAQSERAAEATATTAALAPGELEQAKVLMVLGEEDAIIVRDETIADATEVLGGEDHLEVRLVKAGHEFPVTKANEVVDYIAVFWGLV